MISLGRITAAAGAGLVILRILSFVKVQLQLIRISGRVFFCSASFVIRGSCSSLSFINFNLTCF